jgi:hypothetical protein
VTISENVMSQENASDDFDWVTAQARCSAAMMFERLRTRVREDVQRAGTCRFVAGEAVYSDWELRRMALEQLFFEESEEPE